MSHKVHPKIFRVKGIEDWLSQGFYGKKPFNNVKEDFIIRSFLTKKLKESSVDRIEIERYLNKINVVVYSARPGIIIGRGGEGIEKLRLELLKEIFKKNKLSLVEWKNLEKKLKIEVKEISNLWTSSVLVGQ